MRSPWTLCAIDISRFNVLGIVANRRDTRKSGYDSIALDHKNVPSYVSQCYTNRSGITIRFFRHWRFWKVLTFGGHTGADYREGKSALTPHIFPSRIIYRKVYCFRNCDKTVHTSIAKRRRKLPRYFSHRGVRRPDAGLLDTCIYCSVGMTRLTFFV